MPKLIDRLESAFRLEYSVVKLNRTVAHEVQTATVCSQRVNSSLLEGVGTNQQDA